MDDPARLALRFYEAAIDGSGWDEPMADMARLFGADMAMLHITDVKADRPVSATALAAHRIPPDALAEYGRDLVAHDPWMQLGLQRLAPLEAASLDVIFPGERIARMPRFRHIMHHGIPARFCIGALLDAAGEADLVGTVSLLRTGPSGQFAQGTVASFQPFLRHLQRAVVAHAGLHGQGAAAGHADALVEAGGQAGATLTGEARLLHATDALRTLVKEGWFRLAAGQLAPADTAMAGRFATLVAAAAAAAAGGRRVATPFAGEMALRHPQHRAAALVLRILPLRRPRPAAVVIVRDPSRTRPPMAATLRDAFGLSAAEARLAVALCEGLSPAEVAAARGVALATIRSQLAELFRKTGARRQAELVRRLSPYGE